MFDVLLHGRSLFYVIYSHVLLIDEMELIGCVDCGLREEGMSAAG